MAQIPARLKIMLRILLVALAIVFLSVALILTFWEETLVNRVIKNANSRHSGELMIETAELSWIRHFPAMTLELRDFTFYEHPESIRPSGEVPIVIAGKIELAFNLFAVLFTSGWEISRLEVYGGAISLSQGKDGMLNIERALVVPGKPKEGDLSINLNSVVMDSVRFTYQAYHATQPVELDFHQLNATLSLSDSIVTASIVSTQEIRSFRLASVAIRDAGILNSDLDIEYDKRAKTVSLNRGKLKYRQLELSVEGTYDHYNGRKVHVRLDGVSNERVILKALINKDVLALNKELLDQGKITLKGTVSGKLDDGIPEMNALLTATGISMNVPGQTTGFKDFGFEISFRSGFADDFSEAVVEVKKLRGEIPGGSVKGMLQVRNFVRPVIAYHVHAYAKIDGYDRIFNVSGLQDIKGHVSVVSDFEGALNLSETHRPDNPVNARIEFSDIGFTLQPSGKKVSGMTGNIVLANYNVSSRITRLLYENSLLSSDILITHPYHLLFDKDQDVMATVKVHSDRFYLNDLKAGVPVLPSTRGKINNMTASIELASSTNRLRGKPSVSDFDFRILKLSAAFDSLPDLVSGSGDGNILFDTRGTHLKLNRLELKLPQSNISLQGNMAADQVRSTDFNAALVLNKIPVGFVVDLITIFEDKPGEMPVGLYDDGQSEMSGTFNIQAALLSAPFAVRHLKIRDSRIQKLCVNSVCWSAEDISLEVTGLDFYRPTVRSGIKGFTGMNGKLVVNSMQIPGIGKSSLEIRLTKASGTAPQTDPLEEAFLHLNTPNGSVHIEGTLKLPVTNRVDLSSHVTLNEIPYNSIETLLSLIGNPGKQPSVSEAGAEVRIRTAGLNMETSMVLQPFSITKLVADSSQADLQIGDSTYVNTGNFNASLSGLSFYEPASNSGMGIRSLDGSIRFDSIGLPLFGKSMVSMSVQGLNDKLTFKVTSGLVDAYTESGTIELDVSAAPYRFHIRYLFEEIPLANLCKLALERDLLSGPVNLGVNISGTAGDEDVLKSLQGRVDASGTKLTLHGIKLDEFLRKYEKSQNFDLVDLTAFAVAGPLGPVVTKGSDFVNLLSTDVKSTDKTPIGQLMARITVKDGVLATEDVAFATKENRVAVVGKVDFVKRTIPGVTIAVVDKKGCRLLNQKFYGEFRKIQHGKVEVASTLAGSVTNLANTIVDTQCKPFYQGAVQPPR